MWWTRPWIASARLAMAVVAARFEPPSAIASRSRSIASAQIAGQRPLPATPPPRVAVDAEIAHGGREPVLEIGVEAVLRLAGLQVEEAEHQRAGEAEQRGRERNAHAAERRGEALLQRVEDRAGVAADLEAVDHVADRADGLDQAPEGAEQAEEDQQAGHVARHVARLVEPGRDRIEDAAHHLRARSPCGRCGRRGSSPSARAAPAGARPRGRDRRGGSC